MNDLWSPSPVNSFSSFVWKEGSGSWCVTISRDSQKIIGTCCGSIYPMFLLSWMLTILLFHEILGWFVPYNRCTVSLVNIRCNTPINPVMPSLAIDCYCVPVKCIFTGGTLQLNTQKVSQQYNYVFHDKEDHNLEKCSHQPQYLRQPNDILTTQWSDSLHWSQSNDDDNCDHEMIRNLRKLFVTGVLAATRVTPSMARPVPWVSVTLSRSGCKKSDGKLRFNWQKVVRKIRCNLS